MPSTARQVSIRSFGSGASATSSEAASGSDPTSGQTVVASVPATTELDVDDPSLVNYVQRYNEIVLGQKPFNWGNAILLGLIGLVAVGGGGFVATREKLVKVSFGDTRKAPDGYSAEVIDFLPTLAGLKPTSRNTLKNVLSDPQKAEKVLSLMDAVIFDQKNEVNR